MTPPDNGQVEKAGDVVTLVNQFTILSWSFSALQAAFEYGLPELLREPRTVAWLCARTRLAPVLLESMLDVLEALGVVRREGEVITSAPAMDCCVSVSNAEWLVAKMRSARLQQYSFIEAAMRGDLAPGWKHADSEILRAQGRLGSMEMAEMFARRILPSMNGLRGRLEGGVGQFLDVGAGVGSLSIAMTRRWPNLRVLAIEPALTPFLEARKNIATTALEDRIQIRQQAAEDLADERLFDLAWMPQMFMDGVVLRRGLATVWRALKPGGWVWLPALNVCGTKLQAATARLRNALWGGNPLTPGELAMLLAEANFDPVREFGNSAWGEHVFVIAQRPG